MKVQLYILQTIFLILITCSTACGSRSGNKCDLSDRLVLFYDINEGKGSLISDYSGNNYHGILDGTPGSAWALGVGNDSLSKINRALDIGNTKRSIRLTKIDESFDQISLSLWIRPLYFDKNLENKEYSLISSSTLGSPNLTINNQGKVIFSIVGEPFSYISETSVERENQWCHLCLTYNSDKDINLYINGQIAMNRKCEPQIALKIDSTCTIGYFAGKEPFDGIVDNFIIHNKILNQHEIESLNKGNLPSKTPTQLIPEEKKLLEIWPDSTYNTSVIEPDFPANPLEKDNWALTMNDEFNGSDLNKDLWIPYYLRHRTSDDKAAQADYTFKDGCLILKIEKDKNHYGNNPKAMRVSSIQTFDKTNLHKPGQRQIETTNKFSQKYGYFEIRAKTQIGSGNLCAFWLVGTQESETTNGEIDIFEQPGHMGSNAILFNLYKWDDAALGTPVVSNGWKSRFRFSNSLTSTFNVYALEWDEHEIKLYFNNKLVNVIPKSPAYDMAVLLSLYESNDWYGDIDKDIPYPKQFIIDYIRIYEKNENK